VRLGVVTRLPWIKKQQAGFTTQERQSPRRYVSGETHFVFGNRLRLRLIEQEGAPSVTIKNTKTMTLRVRSGSDVKAREKVVIDWVSRPASQGRPACRRQMGRPHGSAGTPMGHQAHEDQMGFVQHALQAGWLNLELAKKAPQCLEYVVVHELSHFIERKHNDRL
jgi:predicted metal-dependent hydrolase